MVRVLLVEKNWGIQVKRDRLPRLNEGLVLRPKLNYFTTHSSHGTDSEWLWNRRVLRVPVHVAIEPSGTSSLLLTRISVFISSSSTKTGNTRFFRRCTLEIWTVSMCTHFERGCIRSRANQQKVLADFDSDSRRKPPQTSVYIPVCSYLRHIKSAYHPRFTQWQYYSTIGR